MRVVVVTALALGFALASPAEAQTRLPRKSPAERQVDDINRNLQQEQRRLKLEQQLQIDNNQLRQQLDRQRTFSNPSPPARIQTCPPGSVGC